MIGRAAQNGEKRVRLRIEEDRIVADPGMPQQSDKVGPDLIVPAADIRPPAPG